MLLQLFFLFVTLAYGSLNVVSQVQFQSKCSFICNFFFNFCYAFVICFSFAYYLFVILADGSFFQCCPNGKPVSGSDIAAVHCAGIQIESDDPFWKDRECLSFVRTQSAPALDCKPGPSQQVFFKYFFFGSLPNLATFIFSIFFHCIAAIFHRDSNP